MGGSPVAESDQQSMHPPTQPILSKEFHTLVQCHPELLDLLNPVCTALETALAWPRPRNSALRLRLPLPVSGGDPGTAFGQSPDSIRRKRAFFKRKERGVRECDKGWFGKGASVQLKRKTCTNFRSDAIEAKCIAMSGAAMPSCGPPARKRASRHSRSPSAVHQNPTSCASWLPWIERRNTVQCLHPVSGQRTAGHLRTTADKKTRSKH